MEADRIAMDKEFERIRDTAFKGPEINLKNIAQYAPRVKKLDVSIQVLNSDLYVNVHTVHPAQIFMRAQKKILT